MSEPEILQEGRLWRDDEGVLHAEGFEVRFPPIPPDYKPDLDIGIAGDFFTLRDFFTLLAQERGI